MNEQPPSDALEWRAPFLLCEPLVDRLKSSSNLDLIYHRCQTIYIIETYVQFQHVLAENIA
jgi:hypothetical protein